MTREASERYEENDFEPTPASAEVWMGGIAYIVGPAGPLHGFLVWKYQVFPMIVLWRKTIQF